MQVAAALKDPTARDQTRAEYRKLLFRGAITNAFRRSSDYFGGVLSSEEKKSAPWHWIAKVLANAMSHNYILSLREKVARRQLPLCWAGINLSADDHGRKVDDVLNYSQAVDLLFSLRDQVIARTDI